MNVTEVSHLNGQSWGKVENADGSYGGWSREGQQ